MAKTTVSCQTWSLFTSEDQLEAIAINSTKSLGYKNLKEKQLEARVSFMQENHTYVALATGYQNLLIICYSKWFCIL